MIDTSTLLRTLQVRHPDHETATHALELLAERGQSLHIVPQNLFELWVVATRPAEQNGLGMQPAAAAVELLRLKSMFILLPDIPAIYPLWESLVTHHGVIGKPAHDARLVAALQAHGLTALLTFDQSGFSRYPGIKVIHPADVTLQND